MIWRSLYAKSFAFLTHFYPYNNPYNDKENIESLSNSQVGNWVSNLDLSDSKPCAYYYYYYFSIMALLLEASSLTFSSFIIALYSVGFLGQRLSS